MSGIGDSTSESIVSFDSLPLGARFRYPDGKDIWVKIEARGDSQCGVIAKWEPYLDWPGQAIFTFEDSPEKRAAGKVEWLDGQGVPRPAGSHHGTPDLFETDVKLLNDCMEWIHTARKSEKYGPQWLPSTVDFLKSRLFWRIRSGKQPLPHAPPCAYSCPWYELIEDDRPHWVWENVRIYQRGFRDNGSPACVSVAQTLYQLTVRQSDCSLLLAYGPYHFKAWAGQQMVPAHVDGKDVQRQLDGWYIQYLKNVELT